jgi:hypothetical protein
VESARVRWVSLQNASREIHGSHFGCDRLFFGNVS